MKDLDVMIILNSGANEQKFAEHVFDIRGNTKDRLLWILPKKYNPERDETNYRIKTIHVNHRDKIPNWHTYSVINPPTYDEWISKIECRISDDPKTENAVLLVDDCRESGETINQIQCELIKLGYQKEHIFSYAKTIRIGMSRYQLLDSQRKEITIHQLFELLK